MRAACSGTRARLERALGPTGLCSLSLALWLLAGCAGITSDIRVETRSGPGADVGSYRTYGWLESGEIVNDPRGNWEPPGFDADTEIRAVLQRELGRRGLREVVSDPDLVVAFTAGVNSDVLRIAEDPDSGLYTLQSAPKAALVVVFIDARSGRPVWVGTAVGEAAAGRSPGEVRRRIDYAVTQMLRGAGQ